MFSRVSNADLNNVSRWSSLAGLDQTLGIVSIKHGDQQGKIRMDKDPGTQNPLDDKGPLVLNKFNG
ncbi:hypothetical protein EYY96_17365 [Hafnia alvei]|uniref:Uncharacterized protein n=1 Tax=Hafnia alvei TaxID=569 RepID=A0ABD7Q1D4_HAFAL|nr:hypothetical protein EYY96_17365 [Hafnia alvei]